MHLDRFFRLSLAVQLLVGIALFSVSFLIELAVLQTFLAGFVMTLVLAGALELGKATAIIWHQYLAHARTETVYPPRTRRISVVFRSGLVALSVLCSLLYLGVQLDRPHLDAVRAAELATLETHLKDELGRLDAQAEQRARRLDQQHQAASTALLQQHQGRIDALEQQLREEMDNVVGGVFKGPRYEEIQQRLSRAEAHRDAAVRELVEQHTVATAALTREHAATRQSVLATAETRRAALHTADFAHDDRTQHPLVAGFIRTIQAVTGQVISAPLFVFGLALFLALLMELGILLAFETVTLLMIPVLQAQHREAVSTEAMIAEVGGSATREAIRHREAIERIRQSADHVVKKAWMHHDQTAAA